jgi:two-component system nitrogen regulation response regulator GlnG
MPTLLAVDDEAAILRYLTLLFRDHGIDLLAAPSAARGEELFAAHRPDAVVLDLDLPDASGLELFARLHRLDPRVPILFLTGRGTADTAIEAMALGAYDYVLKPFFPEQLLATVARAFEVSRLMRGPAVLAGGDPEDGRAELLVGRDPAMQEVYKSVGRVAPQNVTVLVTGESGTGKELVARAIYQHSRRADRPFLAVNCAAIPEALLESELFGHERGAFTGADQKRVGKFEQCSGGTLFLDEIGDMTLLTQAKVLRVLQDQQFQRVGGRETVHADVRVIAATNRDMARLAAAGSFRTDLYYRLNVYTIHLPPLRERLDDLPGLVEHFLGRYRRELGKEVYQVAPEALELLRRHPWPGNVRELQSVLKYALLRAGGPVLRVEDFLPRLGEPAAPAVPVESLSDLDRFIEERLRAGSQDLYAEWQALTERRLLERVLRHSDGNLSQAARTLGIHRATLRGKVATHGLAVEDVAVAGGAVA